MNDIVINGISKKYGDTAVFESFSALIKAGGIYRMNAPSGAGKTTLLRMLMRLEWPDSGSISGIPDSISAVFQEDRLIEGMSAYGNIALTSGRQQIKRITNCEYADGDPIMQALTELDMEEYADKAVNEMSGGMKRRVALIRAVLHPSRLMLLDEPFTGLDADTRKLTSEYLLKNTGGRTCVIASHIPDKDIDSRSDIIDILKAHPIK